MVTNLVFSETSKFSFLCSVPTLVQSESIWCISKDKTHFLEVKSHKLWSKTFSSCLLKTTSNEEKIVVNKNILIKSKDICFVLGFFRQSRLASLSVYLWMSICRIIIYNANRTKIYSIHRKIFKKKHQQKTINFKTYSMYTEW